MPTIRCQQYSFSISDPFLPGHPLSPEEAQALNSLRAENIRNNLAKQVQKATEGLSAGELLSASEMEKLQELAARYDREYSFGSRRTYHREGPIEAEAKLVARARVTAGARAAGQQLSVEDLERLVGEMAGYPDVMEEARKRVGENQRVASGALESLL